MRRVGLAGRELAAGPLDLDRRRLAVVQHGLEGGAGVVERGAERDADAALDDDAVGDGARPLAAVDPPDAERIGQRERLHGGMRDVAVERALVRLQREVRRDVAVERGAALEPHRGVGGAAAHGGPEGQRAGLRADDVEARGLRDQAGVEGGVALERGERAEAAVLLRGDGLQDDRRRGLGRVAQRQQRVQRGGDRRPSCRPSRGRAASRPRSRPDHGSSRHASPRRARRRRRGR